MKASWYMQTQRARKGGKCGLIPVLVISLKIAGLGNGYASMSHTETRCGMDRDLLRDYSVEALYKITFFLVYFVNTRLYVFSLLFSVSGHTCAESGANHGFTVSALLG